MRADATDSDIEAVVCVILALGFKAHVMPGPTRTAVGITGNKDAVDNSYFENIAGVAETIRVTKPYKLTSLELRPERTTVRVGDFIIGGGELAIIAGPRDLENHAQALAIAEVIYKSGAQFFRSNVFRPYPTHTAFRDLCEEGLEILTEIRERYGLKIVAEAVDEASVELVERHANILQIGARNMQNFSLLRRAGRSRLPILLKRGLAATLDEWLLAAEHIMVEGNYNVILCESGIRTFSDHTADMLDLAVVPALRGISHLPVIIDPSHRTDGNYSVAPLARAGVAVGIDGIMVEVNDPRSATKLSKHELTPEQYMQMISSVRAIHNLINHDIFT